MERNRIRKYEAIWSVASEASERAADPIPEGFVAVPMEILPGSQREQLIAKLVSQDPPTYGFRIVIEKV